MMPESNPLLHRLLRQIALTQDKELDCGEVFALLDVYTEAAADGHDVSDLFPLVQHHLEMCPDCLEEYEALLSVLQTKH